MAVFGHSRQDRMTIALQCTAQLQTCIAHFQAMNILNKKMEICEVLKIIREEHE
jgi:hypothetical protein